LKLRSFGTPLTTDPLQKTGFPVIFTGEFPSSLEEEESESLNKEEGIWEEPSVGI